jgi:hypothetical protein
MGCRAYRAAVCVRESHVRLELVGAAVLHEAARAGRRGAAGPEPDVRGTDVLRALRAGIRRADNLQFHGD